jgi:hypothetical protein
MNPFQRYLEKRRLRERQDAERLAENLGRAVAITANLAIVFSNLAKIVKQVQATTPESKEKP